MDQELLLVVVLALVWWGPTMFAIRELHDREGDRRVLVWKWSAIIAVPLVGPALWYWRGRAALETDPRREIKRR